MNKNQLSEEVDFETPEIQNLTSVNLVLDLETFSTAPGAVTFEIGMASGHADGFSCELPTKVQNGSVDEETINWWNERPIEQKGTFLRAWAEFNSPQPPASLLHQKQFLLGMLDATNRVIEEHRQLARMLGIPFFFWGNAPSFDQTILRNLMLRMKVEPAWTFREEMDVRTLRNLFGGKIESSQPHNALSDALAELQYLRTLYGRALNHVR